MNQRNGVFHLMLIGLMGLAGASVHPGPVDHAWAKMQSWRYRRRGEDVWAVAGTDRVNVMKVLLGGNSSQLNAGRPVEYDSRGRVVRPPYHECTPLMIAAHRGCMRMVRYLLIRGADPNIGPVSRLNPFRVPLMQAAYTGQIELAELLLAHGADVNFPSHGSTALSSAVGTQQLEMVRFLLARGAEVRPMGSEFMNAVKWGNQELVSLLLDRGAEINGSVRSYGPNFFTPLARAALSNDLGMVRLLLDRGAVFEPGRSERALEAALAKGSDELCDMLLERVSDPNSFFAFSGQSLLAMAAFFGRVEILKKLYAKDVRVGGLSATTALHWIGNKDPADADTMVKLLLTFGADINMRDQGGDTPLNDAAETGHADAAEALIRHGADVHARDKNGMTPLHAAGHYEGGRLCYRRGFLSDGFDDVARVLVERGAELSGSLAASLMARKRALYKELTRIRRERLQALRSLLRQSGTYRDIDTLILQLAGQSEAYIRRFYQLGAHNE